MKEAALFFRQRAFACFHRRRSHPVLSPEWSHEVAEARRFIVLSDGLANDMDLAQAFMKKRRNVFRKLADL